MLYLENVSKCSKVEKRYNKNWLLYINILISLCLYIYIYIIFWHIYIYI